MTLEISSPKLKCRLTFFFFSASGYGEGLCCCFVLESIFLDECVGVGKGWGGLLAGFCNGSFWMGVGVRDFVIGGGDIDFFLC